MVEIRLTFDSKERYVMELHPAEYWKPFMEGFDNLSWEQGPNYLMTTADTFSILLEILVQARHFHRKNPPMGDQ